MRQPAPAPGSARGREPGARRRARRRARTRAVVLLLALVAAAGVATVLHMPRGPAGNPRAMAAALPEQVPHDFAQQASQGPTPSPSPPPQPGPDRGREVFLRDCAWCHGEHAQGTGVAPSLLDKGPADIDFWLSTGRMPLANPDQRAESGPPSYDGATIRDIVGYVGSLGARGKAIPEVQPGDMAKGQSLFITHCAACHSTSGTGVIVVNGQQAPQLYHQTPRQIAEAVRLGPGEMPPFSDKEVDQAQLDDLVTYAASLGDPQVKGGNGLDQFGPIFEGSIAWLIPVPVLVAVLLLLGQRRKKQ
ncbi:MAG TPA: c-type cytochrome [Marmoricola sp.]|nr:c-type cytochrome [Marmoricola sp.]